MWLWLERLERGALGGGVVLGGVWVGRGSGPISIPTYLDPEGKERKFSDKYQNRI